MSLHAFNVVETTITEDMVMMVKRMMHTLV